MIDRTAEVESTPTGPRVRLNTWFDGALEECILYMTPAQAQMLGEALIEAANTAGIGGIASFDWDGKDR